MAKAWLGASLPMPTSKVIYTGDCPGALVEDRIQYAMDNTGSGASDYNTIQLEDGVQYIYNTIRLARTNDPSGYQNGSPPVTTWRDRDQLLDGVTILGGTNTYFNWATDIPEEPANKAMWELPMCSNLTIERVRWRNKWGPWDTGNTTGRATNGVGLWAFGGYEYDRTTTRGIRLINCQAHYCELTGFYIGDWAGPDNTSMLMEQCECRYCETGITVTGTNLTAIEISKFRMGDPVAKRPFHLRSAPTYQFDGRDGQVAANAGEDEFGTGYSSDYRDPWGNPIRLDWTDAWWPLGYHSDNDTAGSWSWNRAMLDYNGNTRQGVVNPPFVAEDGHNWQGPPEIHIYDTNCSPQTTTQEKLYAIVNEHCAVYVDNLRIERQCGAMKTIFPPEPSNPLYLLGNRMNGRLISTIKNFTTSGCQWNPIEIETSEDVNPLAVPAFNAGYPLVLLNCNFANTDSGNPVQEIGGLKLPPAEWSDLKRIMYVGAVRVDEVAPSQEIIPYAMETSQGDQVDSALILDFPPSVALTSTDAAFSARLPAAKAGKRLRGSIGATGCKLRCVDQSNDTINNVDCSDPFATNNIGLNLPANSTYEVNCQVDGAWIATIYDSLGASTNPQPS